MLKKILPFFLLPAAVSCSDRKYEAGIAEVFGRHSYLEHSPREIKELLASGGAAALKKLDPYAETAGSTRRFRRVPGGRPNSASGLLIGSRGGGFCVFRAFRRSPAAAAGLRDGDRIMGINGVKADAETLARGTAGAAFSLKVARLSGGAAKKPELLDVRVEKGNFPFPMVFGFYDAATRTAFVRVSVFFEGSGRLVGSGLETFARAGARKAVFDLRGNMGGLPEEAAEVLNGFAAEAGPVLELRSRHQRYTKRFSAPGRGRFAALRTAVLTDGGTSMTAEAFAAALRDMAGAAAVGGTTRGSVSVQRTFNVGRKKYFQLTVARLFPPSGRDLEGAGLAPDYGVELSPGRAAALKKAWESSAETALLDDPVYGAAVRVLAKQPVAGPGAGGRFVVE